MLEIDSVRKRYKKELVLDQVSLTIADGESVSLIGESGSGKSTLSRLILGIEKPCSGNVLLNGIVVNQIKKRCLYKDIQPVFQDNSGCFNPKMKIGDSLSEPMENFLRIGKSERRKKVEELLEMVELSKEMVYRYPHELSGGQQKRVCIARAISINPKLILLDEAVSGLDATIIMKILMLLKALQKEIGCSYLFITHDIRAALYMSPKIIVMKEGQIVETVTGAMSFSDFTHPYAKQLVGSKVFNLKIQEETK